MSYETASDPLVSTMLELGKSAALANLVPHLGASAQFPAVRATYNFPADLQLMSECEMPALTLYRQRTVSLIERTFRNQNDQRTTMQVGYILPCTSPRDASNRWPILHRVWAAVIEAWWCGMHASYQSGAEVLSPLGVTEGADNARVEERFIGGNGKLHIGFVGTFDITWRPIVDDGVAALPLMAGVDAKYHIDQTAPDTATAGDVEDEIDTA